MVRLPTIVSAPKKKFYVVWEGKTPGVYRSWAECQAVIRGHPGAKFKSFPTLDSANVAYEEGATEYWGTGKFVSGLPPETLALVGDPVADSLCVDAALNADTKVLEYRGVWYRDRSIVFQQGPFESDTVNVGEFLAIVHALGFLTQQSLGSAIYTDSRTAMAWVRKKAVKSKSMEAGQTDEKLRELVTRALRWLENNAYRNEILKWESAAWGENPADYGRK